MPIVRIEDVENKTEELMLAGMITSTAYLAWLRDRFNERYFINDQTRLLAEVILEYYDMHQEAPKAAMLELYESIIDYTDIEDIAIIKKILKSIDSKYGNREVSFEVLTDTTEEYFNVRSMEVLTDTLSGLTKRGRTDEAKEELDRWYKDPKGVQSTAISPFDQSLAPAVLESQLPIHKFDSALDHILPQQTKNKFYTFLGGTKSGKSQWLGWLATEFLRNGLKVAVWEFELQQIEFLHRVLSAITGKQIDSRAEDRTAVTTLPIFDCELNRTGECENPNRPDNDDLDDFSEYESDLWIPCTHCRGTRAFVPTYWKMDYNVKIIRSAGELQKEQQKWRRQHGDNLRIFNHSPQSFTVDEMKRDIERLRLIEGFIPDVIIIDHADNLKPSRNYKDKRHELGNIWSDLSDLSKQGYLVWTASQTNRAGWYTQWIEPGMVGEDASKFMVCDGVISLNQYADRDAGVDEYYWCVQRLRAFFFRGQRMPNRDVMVLHDFSRYIACLDCEIM